jgi:hypothetical protein
MSQHSSVSSENVADFEGKRLQFLQQMLDRVTLRRFEHLGAQQGWRCLEMGAGEGCPT